MNSQSEHPSVPCPSCGQPLVPPRASCAACGIVLTGPDAVRLWQVDQQLATLRTERQALLLRLRAQTPGSLAAASPRYPAAAPALAGERDSAGSRSLSGQQIILGLGALLVLSAAALFTVVVWFVVGLAAQAVILAGLIAVAVAGSRLFSGRRLAAAAETAGVIAVGLTLVGAEAAHARGLADLDRFPIAGYWSVALLMCGLLFVGFDRIVAAGAEARPLWIYPPAAAAVLSAAPWCVLAALDVTGLAAQAGVGIAAVVVGSAAFLLRTSAHRPSTRAAALLAALVAVGGAVLFAGLGLVLVYDPTEPAAARYTAAVLLLLAVGAAHWTPARDWTPAAVTTAVGVVLPAALLEAPYQLVAVIAVPLAVAGVLLLRSWPAVDGDGSAPWGWTRSVTAGVLWLQIVLLGVVVGARDAGTTAWWAPVLPAAALLVVSVAGLGLFRSSAWVWAVQAALAVTAWSALLETSALTTFCALVGLTLVELGVAILAVRRARLLDWLLSSERPGLAHLVELLAVAAAAVSFIGSWIAAALAADEVEVSAAVLTAVACYATALAVYVYAAQPDRLASAYLGTLLTSVGGWLLLDDRGVSLVEAYTLPPAVLLALVGVATHRRARGEGQVPGSMLTAAPALAVALGPSTWYAVTEGGTLRTVLVVAAALACLLGGFELRWKAPVLVGALSLGLVAVTLGGPYLAYVPGWMTIGAAGAVLLAVGVSWESAVVAGRRSTAWFGSLR